MMFFRIRKSPNSKYNETKKVILDTLAIIVNSKKDLTRISFMPPISYLLIKTFSKKKGREYKLDTLEFN
jgi:ribosomal protein L11